MGSPSSTACAAFDPTPGDALEELAELWLSLGDRHRDGYAPRADKANRPNLKDANIR